MKKIFLSKIKESVICILPISMIIILLSLIFVPNCGWSILCFSFSSILLMIGICLFNIGNDLSLMKMGGYVGSHLSKTKKVALMLICSFIIGVIVTIAESDLALLASQVPSINKWIFTICVAIGVGFFLLLATLRILFRIKIKYVLGVAYLIIFVLMFFTPKQFLPIAFDASGVTTGAISVPFIMAFGLGISAVRSGENSQDDGFGLLAMCSVGPIFSIMLLGTILGDVGQVVDVARGVDYSSFASVINEFGYQIVANLKDVVIILLPILLFFLVYNFSAIKLPFTSLARLGIGVLYTYVGIVMFFVGAKCGFLPLASDIAINIYNSSPWLLLPICAIVGLSVVVAEPAVHVLNKQVEELSTGTIKKKHMLVTLSIGVAIAILLSAIRILFEINILYIFAPLILMTVVLSIFSPNKITAIAFDSGGVAAGTLSSTFILPFMQGICNAKGLEMMTYGFGSVGIIILVPILIVEIMGIKIKINETKLARMQSKKDVGRVSIIEFDVEEK